MNWCRFDGLIAYDPDTEKISLAQT